MHRPWHTSAAVAALETGTPIVPFFVDGLPYDWGPLDMVRAVARSLFGGNAFELKIRFRAPIWAEGVKEQRNYKDLTERVRQAVRTLAMESGPTRTNQTSRQTSSD